MCAFLCIFLPFAQGLDFTNIIQLCSLAKDTGECYVFTDESTCDQITVVVSHMVYLLLLTGSFPIHILEDIHQEYMCVLLPSWSPHRQDCYQMKET